MFQFPRFASQGLCIQPRDDRALPRPGFPIRTSRDQRSRAAPPGLSQLATSFIAGLYQGIHLAPLLLDPLSALGVATRRESRPNGRSSTARSVPQIGDTSPLGAHKQQQPARSHLVVKKHVHRRMAAAKQCSGRQLHSQCREGSKPRRHGTFAPSASFRCKVEYIRFARWVHSPA